MYTICVKKCRSKKRGIFYKKVFDFAGANRFGAPFRVDASSTYGSCVQKNKIILGDFKNEKKQQEGLYYR